jgi:PAS domain S-box-containing protein
MMNFKRVLLIILTLLLSASFTVPSLAQEKAGNVQVDLTAEERAFLTGKQLRLGVDSSRPPFEYMDEKGNYSGICAGFIEECAKRIGVTISKVPGLTVSAAIDKVKSGEIDVIPKVTPTPERGKHLLFTQAFVTFPSVIISRKDARFIGGLDDLGGLKIGVLKGLVVEELLKRDYPRLPLIALTDVKSALMDISTGKIDVFVDNLGTVSYNIEKLGITNLKIAAPTPYNHDLAFGVRKDWPLLASSLDKALASMTNQEKTEIKNRWLAIKYDAGINWRIFVPIGAALFAIISFVLFWNRRLRRVIRERERIEEELKKNARLIELQSTAKANLAEISVELQQAATFEELARTFMSRIAPLMGAAYGVFYLMDEQKQLLQAVGGYGWMEAEAKSRQFRIGEGLAGQCAREKKPLSFNNLQGGSIRITWGGGQFDPRAILLLPVSGQDQILAVIELGALQPFTPEQRALLDEIMPTLALNLLITRRNLTTQELLAKGQEQIAELGKVRKATLNILEDLEVSKKEIDAMSQEQVAIFESLLLGIAFIKDRIILRGNAKLGELFGRPLEEMIGQTTRIWYKNEEEYSGIGASTYEDLKRQAIHQREQELPRKDGSLFWCLFRVRAIDAQDISRGIVCALEDITERKRTEKELKERMDELERFMRLTINREKKMIQLKAEINTLLQQTDKDQKYKIVA